jgi:hypothetical protein
VCGRARRHAPDGTACGARKVGAASRKPSPATLTPTTGSDRVPLASTSVTRRGAEKSDAGSGGAAVELGWK